MTESPNAKPAPDAPKPHPARRWLLRIGIALGVLLAGLVVAAPWIASSSLVRDSIVSSLNGSLQGRFTLDGISTSWLGPTEVRGFRVKDPQGRDVLTLERMQISKGLLGLARTWQNLGDASVESARMKLYEQADGGFSLVRAFSQRETPAGPPGLVGPVVAPALARKRYPAPRVKAHLANVALKLVRDDNTTWELTGIEGDAEMDTLGRYKADLSARTEGAGKVRVTADVSGLLIKNEFRPLDSKASVQVTTEEPIDARPILALLGIRDTLGTLTVKKLEAKIELRSADVRCELTVTGLRPEIGRASCRERLYI